MADELIGVTEAMRILKCGRTTLHTLATDGRLPAVTLPPAYRRQGKRRYFRRADVEKLAASYTPRVGKPPKVRGGDIPDTPRDGG